MEAHIESILEDTEYWGAKRLESRVFRMIRKGKISFYEILEASDANHLSLFNPMSQEGTIEDRIASLEFTLGDLIKGINIAASLTEDQMLTEESREENGTYDPSFRFEHRKLKGSVEERLSQLAKLLLEYETLLEAFLKVQVRRGVVRESRLKEMLAAKVLPRYENGARIVARAWLDPEFKARLLKDGKGTLRELDFALNRTPQLVVVENTKSVHNVIVCTLCSCYPYELLGNAPWWYKNDAYKEAIVRNPRNVLAEKFNFNVPENVEVRVYDSTSDVRYMVLPERPEGTEGFSEDALSRLVTEKSLIGVEDVSKVDSSARQYAK